MKNYNTNFKFRILSLEAKQLYREMTSGTANFNIRNSDGSIKLRLFKGILDYSLDLIELRNVRKDKVRAPFGFRDGKFNYLLDIINLRFDYSLNLFEKMNDIYYREGYFGKDLKLEDNICIKDGLVVAVRTDVKCKSLVDESLLEGIFKIKDSKYVMKNNKPTVKRIDIRKYLYENGFVLDGVKYVRYKRSAGSSRVGHCLFIREDLYKPMMKWSTLNNSISQNNKDYVSFEAYNALSLSSIEDTLELEPKNILVLEDYKSIFDEEVISISKVDDTLEATEKVETIENKIWDGQGLLDESIFEMTNRSEKGMVLLRGRFFKTCAFNTKLSKWFKDNGIKDIETLKKYGYTEAKSVDDIKLVITESSIKYIKLATPNKPSREEKIEAISKWMSLHDNRFGIVKSDKSTHYFDGRMVRTNYQLLNTLELTEEEVKGLIAPTLDYKNLVNLNPEVLRFHIHFNEDHKDPDSIEEKNDIIYALLGINSELPYTDIYKEFRALVSKSFREKILSGGLYVEGTYVTLFGNGYEMLLQTIGKFNGTSLLKGEEVMTTFFNNGETILGERSPHITMGNILLGNNVIKDEYLNYFNLSKEIICINSIENNIMQKLNGCDFDSDTMLITNNKYMVESARRNYKKYKVPTLVASDIPVRDELYNIDAKIQDNKIGEIVNFSQYLNSLLFNNDDDSFYKDICILAALSGMEIDKAKRDYGVKVLSVLNGIRKKVKDSGIDTNIKPLFFKVIQDKRSKEKTKYMKFNTTMDIIHGLMSKRCFTERGVSIPFSAIIDKSKVDVSGGYASKQANVFLENVASAYNELLEHRTGMKDADEDEKRIRKEEMKAIYEKYVDLNKNLLNKSYTVHLILSKLEQEKYSKYFWTAIYILYNDKYKEFQRIMENGKDNIKYIKEVNDEADFKIFDFNYKLV